MQLVNQQHDDVQLAYSTKAARHFAEPPADFLRAVGMKLEQRQQLAEAARCDPHAMQRSGVAVVDLGE